MKFLRVLIVTALLSLAVIATVKYIYWEGYRNKPILVEPERHVVVLGSSLTACAINDTILDDWKNLSVFNGDYVQLRAIIENALDNNEQIDTLLLLSGMHNYIFFGDDSIVNLNSYEAKVKEKIFALSDFSDFTHYVRNKNFLEHVLHIDLLRVAGRTYHDMVLGILWENDSCLTNDSAKWSIKWYDDYKKKFHPNGISSKELIDNSTVLNEYLYKIMDLCREHNITLVLFITPLYHYDRWFSNDALVDYYATLPDSLLIADYQDFPMPDSCYLDVHHLNYRGAACFSKYIKQHGLHTQRLGDYVKEYGQKHKK